MSSVLSEAMADLNEDLVLSEIDRLLNENPSHLPSSRAGLVGYERHPKDGCRRFLRFPGIGNQPHPSPFPSSAGVALGFDHDLPRPEGFGDLQAWIASMRDLDHCCCPPQLFWSS